MLEGLRILVIDDNLDARELLTITLSGYGAQVTAVVSAQAGLETIAQLSPDLLICDLHMPDQDGCSLITQIRSLLPEQGGQTLAIALTGSDYQARVEPWLVGFNVFSSSQLTQTI
jgi:two-component system OmpR family response regulator